MWVRLGWIVHSGWGVSSLFQFNKFFGLNLSPKNVFTLKLLRKRFIIYNPMGRGILRAKIFDCKIKHTTRACITTCRIFVTIFVFICFFYWNMIRYGNNILGYRFVNFFLHILNTFSLVSILFNLIHIRYVENR